MMAMYDNRLLLKMSLVGDGRLLEISTITAKNGKSRRLLFSAHNVLMWIERNDDEPYAECDGYSYMTLSRRRNGVEMEIAFLSGSRDRLTGYAQAFMINEQTIADVCYGVDDCKMLVTMFGAPREQAKIIIPSTTHKYIAKHVLTDKLRKRALCKAMRNVFMYGRDSEITLFGDCNGFFFRERGGICGGLVPHESYISGHDHKDHVKVKYSVHT